MLSWKLNQNLSSVYFLLAKFQPVSYNLSLPMIWQTDIYSQTAKTVFSHLKESSFTGFDCS